MSVPRKENPRRITIVLADDHTIFRHGLRKLLTAQAGFEVIGESCDGHQTLQLVKELKPDVLVLDLAMPGLGGLEVVRQIRQNHSDIRIVILTMHTKEAYVLEALNHGANAFVIKDAPANDLILAIHQVMSGRRYLSPPLTERAIEVYLQKTRDQSFDPYETLTNREREILHLAAVGLTNAEIADRLVLSQRTVETHRRNLMQKLHLHNQADLIRFALQKGILPLEDGSKN